MTDKTQKSFWIRGGIALLILSVFIAPLRGFLHRSHPDMAQNLPPIMRLAFLGGIVCIIVGWLVPIFQERGVSYKRKFSTIFLVLGGLSLFFYPFIVLADVMSFAAPPPHDPTTLSAILFLIFLYGTLAYPVVYIPCLIVARMALKRNKETALFWFSTVPALYIMALIGLIVLGVRFGGKIQ
jgi:hypothetical protein